jgi:hypothetical protein
MAVSSRMLGRLVDGAPLAALVEDGKITKLWAGRMPQQWVEAARRDREKRQGNGEHSTSYGWRTVEAVRPE